MPAKKAISRMTGIRENSRIALYSNVDITADEQLIFRTRRGQSAYFNARKKFDNVMANKRFSYLRMGGQVKIEIPIADAEQCNYISLRNPDFEDRTYYGIIVNVSYISNKVTLIEYAIDVFQTYMFDVTYDYGFIEREHLSESDFNKAEVNPYDPSIYEFHTSENLPSDKQMEKYYTSAMSDMTNFPQRGSRSVVCFEISDFDTSELPNVQEQFFDKFDAIIKSNGDVVVNGSVVRHVNIMVGRGYGLYSLIIGGSKYGNMTDILNFLTLQGLVGNIIGAFQCGQAMWNCYSGEYDENYLTFEMSPPKYDVANKKLLTFPYQYLRIRNNEGGAKEYQYEMFGSLQNGEQTFRMIFVPLFDGIPMTTFIPENYKEYGWSTEERIDCKEFPQVGYCTDSYLSFVSAQMRNALINDEPTVGRGLSGMLAKAASEPLHEGAYSPGMEGLAQIGSDLKTGAAQLALWAGENISKAGEFVGSLLGVPTTSASGGVAETTMDINVLGAAKAASGFKTESMAVAKETYRSGGAKPPTYFHYSKAGFAENDYHAGSGNGTLGYYIPINRPAGTYTIIAVRLKDSILEIYDNYFNAYGYNSGRYGIPRACEYMTGGSDIPHFSNYGGKQVTYVKTTDMHVNHALGWVKSGIEQMFNSGIRFIKGD